MKLQTRRENIGQFAYRIKFFFPGNNLLSFIDFEPMYRDYRVDLFNYAQNWLLVA